MIWVDGTIRWLAASQRDFVNSDAFKAYCQYLNALILPSIGSTGPRVRETDWSCVTRLGSYTVDVHTIAVVGISSGAYMAVQLHVANSSIISRAGIVAGGPYYAAEGSGLKALSSCMSPGDDNAPEISFLVGKTVEFGQAGLIDSPHNLRNDRVYVFSGMQDYTLTHRVTDTTVGYYKAFMDARSIRYRNDVECPHGIVVPREQQALDSGDPFLLPGDMDTAGEMLHWFYGPMQPKQSDEQLGELLWFDQAEFVDHGRPESIGLAPMGLVYIPSGAKRGELCHVVVATHGCHEHYEAVGTSFPRTLGFHPWADSNNIIVLYPQTIPTPKNPMGCWDWIGYTGPDYAFKRAPQMTAIRRMIERLVDQYVELPVPAGFKVSDLGATEAAFVWIDPELEDDQINARYGYAVYLAKGQPPERWTNSHRIGTPLVQGEETRHSTDAIIRATGCRVTGLSPDTQYFVEIKAISYSGHYGEPSQVVAFRTLRAHLSDVPQNLAIEEASGAEVLCWQPGRRALAGDKRVAMRAKVRRQADLVTGDDRTPLAAHELSPRVGYHVYRSTSEHGHYSLVNPTPITSERFVLDADGVIPGLTYFFRVTAVASNGTESDPSAPVPYYAVIKEFRACKSYAPLITHLSCGRIYFIGWAAFAVGSNQYVGTLWSQDFFLLIEIRPHHFEPKPVQKQVLPNGLVVGKFD